MKLVVGLGNPEGSYRETYHNLGFDAINILAERFFAPDFRLDKKSNALLSEVDRGGNKVVLCKPQTYMNNSGDAVGALVRYYKLRSADIIVLYDDIDIAKGVVRGRLSGSAGTHNGMRDVTEKLGFSDFARVRIGTGFKPDYMTLTDYVLAHIPQSERAALVSACGLACDMVEDWLDGREWQCLTLNVG